MSFKIQHIIPLIAACLLTACSSDIADPKSRLGEFSFALAQDGLVEEVQTRASRELTATEAADYTITLTDMDGTVWTRQYSQITEADRTQPLGDGYLLSAEDCTAEEAETSNEGWGCHRIAGISDPFSIVKNQTTPVTVNCGMANAGLCVIFDKSFTDFFTEYAVTTDDTRALKFNATNGAVFDDQNHLTSGTIAYYNVEADGTHDVSVIISASAGWDGMVRLNRTLTLQRGKVSSLRVRLNGSEPEEGNIGLSITTASFEELSPEEIVLE